MSYEESDEQSKPNHGSRTPTDFGIQPEVERFKENSNSKPYRSFRSALDFGMGMFYIIIGGLVISVKYFGRMELPADSAYILGGLMMAYGLFRIYRGIVSVRDSQKERNR